MLSLILSNKISIGRLLSIKINFHSKKSFEARSQKNQTFHTIKQQIAVVLGRLNFERTYPTGMVESINLQN